MSTTYRVMYLVRAVATKQSSGLSRALAAKQVNHLKRRGLTAWVETDDGKFVPIKGATRKPASR